MVSNSVSYPDKNCNRKRKCLRNILYVLYVKLKCRRLLHFSPLHILQILLEKLLRILEQDPFSQFC